MANDPKEEPNTGPEFDRWYNLSLGSSFKDDVSKKYCSLRYEFKPASVDQSKPGKLHKNKDNRVSVEFQNNQVGKPKVVFEGSGEDCKETEAILFFDGESFRLERIRRSVKTLRHVRTPGESSASMTAQGGPGLEPKLSPVAKQPKTVNLSGNKFHIVPPPPVPVEVERIDVGDRETSGSGPKPSEKRDADRTVRSPDQPMASAALPGPKDDEAEENQEIDIDDLFGTPDNEDAAEDKADVGFDINVPQQNDTDDEIADVEDSGDEGKGPNAAEALRAQVNAEERDEQSSSSGSSSGSGSSGSGSGSGSSSSSSDGEDSDEVSVNSI